MLYKFNQHSKINENVQAAKSLLLKLAAEDKKKKLKLPPEEKVQFSEEEERKILQNPDFLKLKEFLEKNKSPNLTYPFAYFMFVEGLPMTSEVYSVEDLFKKWKNASPMFHALPLPEGNDMVSYIKSKKDTDTSPSYVKLWDDLDILIAKKPMKEFVDNFNLKPVDPIRKEFRKSIELEKIDPKRKNLLDRLYHAVSDLKKLPPVTLEDSGNVQTSKDAERQLISQAKKYTDYRDVGGIPAFRNTLVAFEAFIEDIETKIKSWGITEDVFITELKSIAPSIKILMYNPDSGVVVTSARSYEGIKSICAVANATHCIKDEPRFYAYTSGRLQISINQLKLDKDDNNYFITLTIDPNGSLTESKYRDNQKDVGRIGENYIKVLDRIGLEGKITDTGEIIDAIQVNFNSELTIKNLLEKIERGKTNKDIIFTLGSISLQKAIESGEFNKEEMNTYKNLIIAIIKKDKNIGYEEIISAFTNPENGGFFVMEDVELFEALTDNKYSKEDVRKIWEITQIAIGYIKDLVDSVLDEKTIEKGKYILDIYPRIAEYVERNML